MYTHAHAHDVLIVPASLSFDYSLNDSPELVFCTRGFLRALRSWGFLLLMKFMSRSCRGKPLSHAP